MSAKKLTLGASTITIGERIYANEPRFIPTLRDLAEVPTAVYLEFDEQRRRFYGELVKFDDFWIRLKVAKGSPDEKTPQTWDLNHSLWHVKRDHLLAFRVLGIEALTT